MKARISIAVTFCRSQFDNNRRLYHSNRCFNHKLMVKPDKSGSINFDDKSIEYVPSSYTFFRLAKTIFYLPSLMVSAIKLIEIFFDICKASNFRAPFYSPRCSLRYPSADYYGERFTVWNVKTFYNYVSYADFYYNVSDVITSKFTAFQFSHLRL